MLPIKLSSNMSDSDFWRYCVCMSKLNSKLSAILCKSEELEGAVGYQWEGSQWRLCDSSPVDAVKLRNECYCDFTVQFVN